MTAGAQLTALQPICSTEPREVKHAAAAHLRMCVCVCVHINIHIHRLSVRTTRSLTASTWVCLQWLDLPHHSMIVFNRLYYRDTVGGVNAVKWNNDVTMAYF